MFIAQGFKSKGNAFWKYIVGSIIVIAASTMGQFPLMIAIAVKSFEEKKDFPMDQTAMLTFLDSNLTLFLMLISFAFALLALYFVVKFLHRQKFIEVTTSRPKNGLETFFLSFGLWTVIHGCYNGWDLFCFAAEL